MLSIFLPMPSLVILRVILPSSSFPVIGGGGILWCFELETFRLTIMIDCEIPVAYVDNNIV